MSLLSTKGVEPLPQCALSAPVLDEMVEQVFLRQLFCGLDDGRCHGPVTAPVGLGEHDIGVVGGGEAVRSCGDDLVQAAEQGRVLSSA